MLLKLWPRPAASGGTSESTASWGLLDLLIQKPQNGTQESVFEQASQVIPNHWHKPKELDLDREAEESFPQGSGDDSRRMSGRCTGCEDCRCKCPVVRGHVVV